MRVVAEPSLVTLSPLVENWTRAMAAAYSAVVAAPLRVIWPVVWS